MIFLLRLGVPSHCVVGARGQLLMGPLGCCVGQPVTDALQVCLAHSGWILRLPISISKFLCCPFWTSHPGIWPPLISFLISYHFLSLWYDKHFVPKINELGFPYILLQFHNEILLSEDTVDFSCFGKFIVPYESGLSVQHAMEYASCWFTLNFWTILRCNIVPIWERKSFQRAFWCFSMQHITPMWMDWMYLNEFTCIDTNIIYICNTNININISTNAESK